MFSQIDLCLFNGLPDAARDDVIFVKGYAISAIVTELKTKLTFY